MKNYRIAALFLALLGIGLFSTFAEISRAGEEPAIYMGKEHKVVAKVDADGVQRVDIVGGGYYYDPNVIVVKVNQPVELRVKKAGGFIPHNIIVKAPEAGIDFKVELTDKFQTISFTPTKTGKYLMYCDHQFLWFKTHKEKGMEGIIEVVP